MWSTYKPVTTWCNNDFVLSKTTNNPKLLTYAESVITDLKGKEPNAITWDLVATDLWTPRHDARRSLTALSTTFQSSDETQPLSQLSQDHLRGSLGCTELSDNNNDDDDPDDDPILIDDNDLNVRYKDFDKCTLIDQLAKVRNILETTNKGRACLPLTEANRPRPLNSSDRRVIADLVINYLHQKASQGANVAPHFSYAELHEIAHRLSTYFQDSPSLWFYLAFSTPESSTTTRKGRNYPYGHLWNKVNNFKDAWRKSNPVAYKKMKEVSLQRRAIEEKRKATRLKRNRKKKPPTTTPAPPKTLEEHEKELFAHPSIAVIRSPDWIRRSSISKDMEETWRKTSKLRQDYFCCEGNTLERYLDVFPCLKSHSAAKVLIQADFHQLYQVPVGKLQQMLRDLHPIIVAEARASKRVRGRETFVETIMKYYDNSTELDHKITGALLALPYAIGTVRLKRAANRRIPTQIPKKESADHFVAFVESECEAINLHNQRANAPGGTIQPYVIAIGRIGDVDYCLVKFLDLSFRTDTIIEGVDLCFKLIFVFNCEYPPQCRHVWQALELVCYELRVSTNFILSAQTLASTCEQYLQSLAATSASAAPDVTAAPNTTATPENDQAVVKVEKFEEELVKETRLCAQYRLLENL